MWMWHLTHWPSSVLLLMTAVCRTGWPDLGWSIWLLLGQLCHLEPCLLQLAPSTCEMVVVLLSHLQWRSPVFPSNTKSQTSQVLVSLPQTRMVIVMGCFQMPLDLQGHFSHLVGWGCGLQSSYWLQTSDHLGYAIWLPLTQNSGHELKLSISSFSLDTEAHARKLRNYGACVSCVWSTMSCKPIHLPSKDSFTNVGTLPTWKMVLTSLIRPPDWQLKGWSWTATA